MRNDKIRKTPEIKPGNRRRSFGTSYGSNAPSKAFFAALDAVKEMTPIGKK